MNHIYAGEALSVDTTSYPTVIITVHDTNPTDEQVIEGIALLDKAFSATTGPCCMLGDGSNIKWVDARARMIMANGVKELEAKYANRIQFAVMVVPNSTVLMLLKGLNLIAKPVVPQILVKSISEAQSVIEQKFQPEIELQ